MNEQPTHIWCDNCKAIQPILIEPMEAPDTTKKYVGGDLVCQECKFIVACIYKELNST